MHWLLPPYLLALVYLATHKDKLSQRVSLGAAWIWFALIPISQFTFALFSAGNIDSTRDLALIQIWADGIGWLFLGISLFCISGIMEYRLDPIAKPTTNGRPHNAPLSRANPTKPNKSEQATPRKPSD
jgi:hypothetical protein